MLALASSAHLTEPHMPWHILTDTHPSTHPYRLTVQRPCCTEVLTAVMLICQRGWRIGLLPAGWVRGVEQREEEDNVWGKGRLSFLNHLSSFFFFFLDKSDIFSWAMIWCLMCLCKVCQSSTSIAHSLKTGLFCTMDYLSTALMLKQYYFQGQGLCYITSIV